jgi:ribosomal protein S18 acetylase RimI-like enzyme
MKSINKTSSDVVIRTMTLKDYDAVLTLWSQGEISIRPQGRDSRKNIRWQLQQPTSLYFIAEDKGEIVGAILGTHDGRKGWINRLVITPAYRQKGIAKRLVEEVEQRLATRGINIVAALIEEGNDTSMHVFERLGYTKHSDILYFSKRKNMKI